MVDQAAAHNSRGNGQEVAAILPVHALRPRQTQEALVHQRRRLPRMARPLAAEIALRNPPQVGHQKFEEPGLRLLVPSAPLAQQHRDFVVLRFTQGLYIIPQVFVADFFPRRPLFLT